MYKKIADRVVRKIGPRENNFFFRLVSLFLLLIFFFGLAFFLSKNQAYKYKEVYGTEYTFLVPSDWEELTYFFARNFSNAYAPKGFKQSALYYIGAYKKSYEGTNNDMCKACKDEIKNLANAKVIKEEKVTVNGRRGWRITFSFTEDYSKQAVEQIMQFIPITQSEGLFLITSASQKDFISYKDVFNHILNSVKIKQFNGLGILDQGTVSEDGTLATTEQLAGLVKTKASYIKEGDLWLIQNGVKKKLADSPVANTGDLSQNLYNSEYYYNGSFWSQDGKYLAYVKTIKEPDYNWGEDLFVWDSLTKKTSKIASATESSDSFVGWTNNDNLLEKSERYDDKNRYHDVWKIDMSSHSDLVGEFILNESCGGGGSLERQLHIKEAQGVVTELRQNTYLNENLGVLATTTSCFGNYIQGLDFLKNEGFSYNPAYSEFEVSPNNQEMVVNISSGYPVLKILDIEGNEVNEFEIGEMPYHPTWLTNSEIIYETSNDYGSQLWELNIDTGQKTLLLNKSGVYAFAHFSPSPDGKAFLYTEILNGDEGKGVKPKLNLRLLDLKDNKSYWVESQAGFGEWSP